MNHSPLVLRDFAPHTPLPALSHHLPFPLMPPKGPWWDLFIDCDSKHNGTYKNAWCRACVDHHVRCNRDADQALVDEGTLQAVRPDPDLIRLGKRHSKPEYT